MLHSKAIQLMQDKAVKAAGVAITTIPGDDSQVIISQDGKKEFHVLPPKARAHQVESLEDFRGAIEVFKVTSAWISEDQVVGVIDAERRRDNVYWPLRYTKPFEQILALNEDSRLLSQSEILRWLKIDLWKCVEDESLITLLEHIEWNNANRGASSIGQGKASIGREIEQEVKSKDQRSLPETFAVVCRVHDNFGEEFTERIILSLQADAQQVRFNVQALPDEVPRAIERRLAHIQERLDESTPNEVPVFFGKP